MRQRVRLNIERGPPRSLALGGGGGGDVLRQPDLARVPDRLPSPWLAPRLRMPPPPPRKASLNGPTARPMTSASGTEASRMTASTQAQKRRTACRCGTGRRAVGTAGVQAPAGRGCRGAWRTRARSLARRL